MPSLHASRAAGQEIKLKLNRMCAGCGAGYGTNGPFPAMARSAAGAAYYCDRQCQKRHWGVPAGSPRGFEMRRGHAPAGRAAGFSGGWGVFCHYIQV